MSCNVTVPRGSCLVIALVLGGCASAPPSSTAPPAYPGQCELLGLEEVEQPSDRDSDQVAIVARYRFGAPSRSPSDRVSLSFLVARERAEDLRSHLAAHPSVLCRPDQQRSYEVDLPPFEGDSGVVVAEPQAAAP